MKIILNGKEKELPQSLKLKETIAQFCKDPKRVIAEVNGEIVKANSWDTLSLKDGDKIELVNFVGGG